MRYDRLRSVGGRSKNDKGSVNDVGGMGSSRSKFDLRVEEEFLGLVFWK